MLHWPVLMFYPEVMGNDVIEDFQETHSLGESLARHRSKGHTGSAPFAQLADEPARSTAVGALVAAARPWLLPYLLQRTIWT